MNNLVIEDIRDYAVFLVDVENRIASWNIGAERVLGFDENLIVGQDLLLLFPDMLAREEIVSFLGSAEQDRIEITTWCIRKDNKRFWANVSISKLTKEWHQKKWYSVVIFDLAEQKIDDKKFNASEIQLRSLATRLLAVHEEERTRIARELHDEFGEMLTALRIDLSLLEKMVSRTIGEPLARISFFEKINGISELLEKAIRSARRIITELRPAVLDELGLLTAIQWQALEFENRTGIQCRFGRIERELSLDKETATSVFRILQEALTNVAMHASASVVTVSLQIVGENMVMEVQDNGKGMQEDKQKDPASTGILSIRERVLALKGEFEIRSKPGEGTALSISVPYKPTNGHA